LLCSKYFSNKTISFINDILEEKYILPFETLFQEGDYLEINLVIILEGKSKNYHYRIKILFRINLI
jgi:hypothetical protein